MEGQAKVIEQIVWVDSGMRLDQGWAPLSEYLAKASPSRTKVSTVGYIMHEDEEIILVGQSLDPAHDTWFGVQMILKKNVVSRFMFKGGITL